MDRKILLFFFNKRKSGLLLVFFCSFINVLSAQTLYVGTAEVNITPKLPVALTGQTHVRIAQTVESPLLSNIIAIESREGNRIADTVVFVACDMVDIPPAYLEALRKEIKQLMPGFNVEKIIVTATHTHSSPVMDTLFAHYPLPKNITQPEEFAELFVKNISRGIVAAWKNKMECSVSWGLSHAVVGYNRRSTYSDGTAGMYGATYKDNFMGIEGYEDHDVNTIFFWNKKNELTATCVNVACPAQQTENGSAVNADYWHEVRKQLKKRFGKQLCVMGWIAAAGDQSPHVMYRFKANERMHKLSGRTKLEEIGMRISDAVIKTYDIVQSDRYNTPAFYHATESLQLPMRIVTKEQYAQAKKERDEVAAIIAADPKQAEKIKVKQYWHDRIVTRYENQQHGTELIWPTEIHIIRIGDIAICTNPFELYTEYGIRIQGRSKALQTFVVQLAGEASYLPTEKAEKGGGYSAIVQSTPVGYTGGQMLVDRTVELINNMMTTTGQDKAK